jgi:hypothetical protein
MKNIYRNKTSIYHIAMVCLFATIFTTVSCSKDSVVDEPDNNDIKDKAEYELYIGELELIGKNIESNWDPDLGIVWLGTDESILPTGTLTIIIDTIVTTSGIKQAWISSATLSTADKLVGTGPEINAKTYFSLGGEELLGYGDANKQWIDFVEIGGNYISGRIAIYDDDSGDLIGGWLMKDAKTGEIHGLFGSFTAIIKQPGW